MARQTRHLTEHTTGAIQKIFSGAVRAAGMSVPGKDREKAISALRMDGETLGSMPAELRKPESVFYSTSYLEARAVAGMLVDLGIDSAVADIVRRDAPDVEVRYSDGRRLFVEQAMVVDEAATRLSLKIDDANIAADGMANADLNLRSLFHSGLLNIRLDSSDLLISEMSRFISVNALADEVLTIARGFAGRVSLGKPNPEGAPILSRLGAKVFYTPCNAKTARPINLPTFHARLSELEPSLRRTFAKKKEKTRSYSPDCRPLWLLLDVDMHYNAGESLPAIARRVLDEITPEPYDRVIIQHVPHAPMVFDC